VSCVVDLRAQTAQTPESQSPPADLEVVLKKYVSAYDKRNTHDLLAIWPDLLNQKKEFSKIQSHLEDPRISDEHMTLRPLETQTSKDVAIVRCERNEQFSKTETKTEFSGDLNMGASPAQSIPPSQRTNTKIVKKTDKIWIKLQQNKGEWVIVSVSEKPLSF
jgi:hypothetical protein